MCVPLINFVPPSPELGVRWCRAGVGESGVAAGVAEEEEGDGDGGSESLDNAAEIGEFPLPAEKESALAMGERALGEAEGEDEGESVSVTLPVAVAAVLPVELSRRVMASSIIMTCILSSSSQYYTCVC